MTEVTRVLACVDRGAPAAAEELLPLVYAALRRLTGLAADPERDDPFDRAAWPRLRERLAATFRRRSRDEWCADPEAAAACVAPVLSMAEAPHHPHNAERATFRTLAGTVQPMPAPRYSATPTATPRPNGATGAEADALLASLGNDAARIADLRRDGALG